LAGAGRELGGALPSLTRPDPQLTRAKLVLMRFFPLPLALLIGCSPPPPTGSVVESSSPAIREGVLTQNLGIETLGERFTPLLPTGCRLPCVKSSTFSTTEDSQPQITLHVLRGDSGRVADQHSLGTYSISGFPIAGRGVPQVLVILGAVGQDLTLDARDAVSGGRYRVTRVGN
jgi:Hsp70 protein